MIAQLTGILRDKAAPVLLLDVNGVGYEVQASLNTFAVLPALGNTLTLLTHFVVREDAQQLFGFASREERQLFRTLIKISGVGPKLALAILSGMETDYFARCIIAKDIAALTRLPGVGKKTAERLVVEMKDRLKEWHNETAVPSAGEALSHGVAQSRILADAETALVALGYKPIEASKALAKLDMASLESSEEVIRAALQTMLQR